MRETVLRHTDQEVSQVLFQYLLLREKAGRTISNNSERMK